MLLLHCTPSIRQDSLQCDTTTSCFVYLFYSQISGGGGAIRGFMTELPRGDGKFMGRILYDSLFFVWVGIILMNIIGGLMLDTFGAMREEKNTKKVIMETQCFVCGMDRGAYEDIGLPPGSPSFVAHQESEHDKWLYVFFAAYLREKDPTDDTGIESFVRDQIGDGSKAPGLDWIPKRTSAVIEAVEAARAAEEAAESDVVATDISVSSSATAKATTAAAENSAAMAAVIQALSDEVHALRSEVREMRDGPQNDPGFSGEDGIRAPEEGMNR